MSEYIVTCRCGHQRRVTENAVGLSGRCPSCGREVIITDDDLIPADRKLPEKDPEVIVVPKTGFEDDDADTEDAVIDFLAPSKAAPSEPHCPRCKRVFRGDWDRIHTPEGLLCNICANMVREVNPAEAIANPHAGFTPAQLAQLQEDLANPTGPPPPDPEDMEPQEKKWFDVDSDRFKTVVMWAGIAVVFLAITVALFDETPSPRPHDATMVQEPIEGEQAPQVEDLPVVAQALVHIILYGARFAGEMIALWIALSWANALPNEGFWKNVLVIGIVALALTVVWWIPFGIVPGIGFVLGLLRPLLVLWFIYQLYQLSLWELLTYIFCHYLVAIAVHIASMFLLFAVAWIFL
ncbi:MAG: hypothetical protein GY851_04070 [bacterium]|nr:hypothetical protein [bacterium]